MLAKMGDPKALNTKVIAPLAKAVDRTKGALN
jgi:hypothetical protein